ncbi:class I SAM-dependent methyltransferase [Microvirga lotononidis]|uniref:Methyltransferase, cyclopropane fatty acid synthase n=1 Tax=Microvirga lotononidis TaxID=864069 RepID=I4YY54_9HYPH|nr:class I SAM-dependent methyltransferase [Microvirga lotononidis]EIM28896.1 methyltransferase, cyclopropane fatty acid synthase [Microvirga lotononidis]WQO26816.1 class I SAM-dependent methyltransferase [Microvirga lotononidis]
MIHSREILSPASVADHYDELDPFYREVWGEHVHHGLWTTGREKPAQAVEALIARLAETLAPEPGQHICDIGCGYGATAEWLAGHYGVHVTGITLSLAQFRQAETRAARSPLLRFMRQDWLANTFPDCTFDHAFAIESSEHMPDKQLFFDEAYRTLRPGGRLAVYAWLAREKAKPWEERFLLEPICREGRLAGMGTIAEYRAWAGNAGFEVDHIEDLSAKVKRTWALCTGRVAGKLITQAHYRRYLLDARSRNRIFALSLPRIWLAYTTGSMNYGLLTAHKPMARA